MILAELKYQNQIITKGYANQTLYVNLVKNEISIKNVTDLMKDKFIGGKGFDLWLMWNSLPKRIVNWNDPENEICIASGPLGGNNFIPGSGKAIVTTISPLTGIIIDSNVGGYFGPYLKFSGFDAIEIQGKAEKEIVIIIDGKNKEIKIEEAGNLPDDSHLLTQILTNKYSKDEKMKKRISIVSTGSASKYSKWGILNFSFYSPKRKWASYKQAGRGGIGTVFADKNIKAIICLSPERDARNNNPADEASARKIGKQHNSEIMKNDPIQNEMRDVGTGHLPDIMNAADLLPVENYRFGAHKKLESNEIPYRRNEWKKYMANIGTGGDSCSQGCTIACSHYCEGYEVRTGPYKGEKVIVDGPEYETIAGCGSNWGVWDPNWILEANFYCDTYGLDTISVGTGIAFVMECYELGIINQDITGGLDLNFGNIENSMKLIHQMAKGEGFGKIVGQGIKEMKKIFAEKYGGDSQLLQDIGMEHKGLEFSEYITKESLAQQGGYGLSLKGPQHDEAWLIFEDMVRNTIPTFEDKAKALCWFPYWRTWFGLNGLCKLPWNDVTPLDNNDNPIKDPETGELCRSTIPKHVNWYAEYFTAITGIKSTPDDLIKMSERVYNFQRIFNIRQGKGLREQDSNLPYRAVGPVTSIEYQSREERYDKQLKEILKINLEGKSIAEKIKILRDYREKQYIKLQDVVYKQRGWSKHGCPTIQKVKDLQLDIDDVIEVISPHQ